MESRSVVADKRLAWPCGSGSRSTNDELSFCIIPAMNRFPLNISSILRHGKEMPRW
jgi:hypothetical protein